MRRFTLRTGIRWKITLAIAAVGALTAVALSLVVHSAARVSMLESAREVQLDRVQFMSRNVDAGRKPPLGFKINDPDLPAQLRQKVQSGRRGTFVQENPGGPQEVWAAVPLGNGQALSLHTQFRESANMVRDLDRALVVGSLAVVIGGSALGVLIGGQISRRLRKAAAAAQRVAHGDPEVRVRDAVGGVVRDETDDLARAVDAMADALQQRLEAERRVTADIAHELRTPVTGLLTAAELLPPGRPTELVRDRAQAMRALVEDVLEVARLDSASERAELQDVALGEFVSRRVKALMPEASIRIVADEIVSTDPRRLERILGNLLANAARYGQPPVQVDVEGRVVRVRDHGPGFPEALLREGPSRFRTGSTDRAGVGHGLGLTIAEGQARVLGARLTFRNVAAPGGSDREGTAAGAVAVLWLPEHAPTATGSFPVVQLPQG
ncbi:two-component system sensor histidine kinase CseC [Streptomyces xanthophaeus]|uniref:Sensor protein CseC n=2 Tax=Streptomyces xanthophaeus TaxID=67385 RepID=A0A919H3B1_9ACTN|nr:two-component system sensor histidine kinase CseC [Streptomyces xanthophaeus]WCD87110.1 Sensor protein CseC [Streptomyces xanthophaeus]WST23171.1 HAMP domain-containing histidine kinase [Streptomyces xanthophaeus]WST61853.1 HAMP domain-containing histidine kinase [Streptomyces xanthophaeus]GHI88995.1 sensor protein CseC [Streptomyces xanthophaeus]